MHRSFISLTILLLCELPISAAQPDENAGRRGTYQAKTSIEGYNYYVCVPKTYSDDNPAGIHLFFHGQGGHNGAGNFGQWMGPFLERHNLIGINMQYMDGDNLKNVSGKRAAAEEAVRQVAANYKVVVGRGAVGSFSGGGVIHVNYCARAGRHIYDYPFTHNALYGSNYWGTARSSKPLTWFIGLGTGEWDMGTPTLGRSQRARFSELLAEAMKGGSSDIYLKIIKGKGHSIAGADVADSSALFRRSDIAYAPFIYAPDFAEREFRDIVAQANALRLAQASRQAAELANQGGAAQDIRDKATRLHTLVERRIEAAVNLIRELSTQDLILFTHYYPILLRQIAGHSREEEMRGIQEAVRQNPELRNAMAAWQLFGRNFNSFFDGSTLSESGVATLERIKDHASGTSLLGKMVNEFLQLRP